MKSLFSFTRRPTQEDIARKNIKSVLQDFMDVYKNHPNFQTDKVDWQAHYDIAKKTLEVYQNNRIESLQDSSSTTLFIDNVVTHVIRLEEIRSRYE